MPTITYIEHNGTEHPVDVPVGKSLMQGAVENNVPGIDADCGGECACATCHVYVEAAWYRRLEPREDMEEGMLESAWEPRENSRLSCQIHITADLDGLEVTIPQHQGAD